MAWTEEQKEKAKQKALARWSDPAFKEAVAQKNSKPPCCPACGCTDILEFYIDPKGRRTNAYCKECHKQKCKDRYHAMSLLDRQAGKASKYGISSDEYRQLYNKQGGRCAICGEYPKGKRGLAVDHCHATNVVRGLLCHGCNIGIGCLQDNISLLQKSIKYLEQFGG